MPSSYRGSHHRFPSYPEAHRKRWALRLLSAGLQQRHCTTAAVLLCEPVWISVFTAQNLQSQFLSGQNKFSSLWQYIKTFLDIRTKFRHSNPHVGDKNLHPTSISMYLFNQSKNASSYHFYFTVTACWNWKNLLIPPLLPRHSLSLLQWDLRIKYHGTNCVRSPQKLPFFLWVRFSPAVIYIIQGLGFFAFKYLNNTMSLCKYFYVFSFHCSIF